MTGAIRDKRGLPWLEDLLQDARFGARTLRRAPLVTAVALVTLTLAIGSNSAIFSLVDPLLFRDLPVRDPASLVQFTFQFPRDPPLNMFSLANYERRMSGEVHEPARRLEPAPGAVPNNAS